MTAGIVCEYNPMHNGHIYHIEKTKAAGAESIVCVMSGNFVQRGECACIDKWQRAEIAVRCGADVVIDLPVPWATGSAESFARGSVCLLSAFGIDFLSFGSETDDKELLMLCAEATENERVGAFVREQMSQGTNYPTALCEAVGKVFGDEAKRIISSPNSTLAAEYIRQLKLYSPDCTILPVRRVGAEHDADEAGERIASASRIRKSLDEEYVCRFLPAFMQAAVRENLGQGTVCRIKNAERAILSSLREMKKEDYYLYVTDESGLSSRIYEAVKSSLTLDELYEKAKSRNYTHARVRREVLNLYLKTEKDISKGTPPYIRILAANEKGLSLLSQAKRCSSLPVVTRHSEIDLTDELTRRVYELQCSSTDKFALMGESLLPCGEEQKKSMIIVRG